MGGLALFLLFMIFFFLLPNFNIIFFILNNFRKKQMNDKTQVVDLNCNLALDLECIYTL